MSNILIYAEIRDGVFKGINAELVTSAKNLAGQSGGEVHMAVLGSGIDAQAAEGANFEVSKVFTVDKPELADYSSQGYAAALEAVIAQSNPKVVLFGATAMGKDLSARTAARIGASLFADCTEVSIEDGNLTVLRPVYSGKVYVQVVASADIQMASVRPNVYAPAQAAGSGAEVVAVDVELGGDAIKGKVKELVTAASGAKDLTESEIIVAGGRSLKSGENFKILQDLADVLGATVGASRAAVDAGYVPHSIQIGQTGKVVNPKLYFAIGISGAIQHLVGMRTSKVIVAVNKDENAPIFEKSDYGIVGDLFEVVPKLTEEFKALLG
ncbi:MAG: electron transfer flavoprotein subunit alpha/FixB family protein [Candidatus Latescibacterota bacterium]|jgi:electron transfer flavoprotein alpha subunit